jgi:hypothetical protein
VGVNKMIKKTLLSVLFLSSILQVQAGKVEIKNDSIYPVIIVYGPHDSESNFDVFKNLSWRFSKYKEFYSKGCVKEDENKTDGIYYLESKKNFKITTDDNAFTTRISFYRVTNPTEIVENVTSIKTGGEGMFSKACTFLSSYIPYVNVLSYFSNFKTFIDDKFGWAIMYVGQKESKDNKINNLVVKTHEKTIIVNKEEIKEEINEENKEEEKNIFE